MRRAIALAVALIAGPFAGCGGSENKPPETPADETPPPPAPPSTDATKVQDQPGSRMNSTYDKQQTEISVKRATRQAGECAKLHPEGPFGDIPLTLIISSKGKIGDAQLPPPYDGTAIGKCVEQSFEHEMIPPWNGPDERMSTTVSLKKPEGAAPAPDAGAQPKKK